MGAPIITGMFTPPLHSEMPLPELLVEAERIAAVNEQFQSHLVASVIRELATRLEAS